VGIFKIQDAFARAEGKPLPTELRREEAKWRHDVELEDDNTAVPRTHIDDEYAHAGERDPKILITTSRDPSTRLVAFAKEMKLVFPNAQRINRGGMASDACSAMLSLLSYSAVPSPSPVFAQQHSSLTMQLSTATCLVSVLLHAEATSGHTAALHRICQLVITPMCHTSYVSYLLTSIPPMCHRSPDCPQIR